MKTFLPLLAFAASAVAGYAQTLTNPVIMVADGDTLTIYTNVAVLPPRPANKAHYLAESNFWNCDLISLHRTNGPGIMPGMTTNPLPSAQFIIDTVKTYGSLTNLVLLLCEWGEVCKMYGHQWRPGRPGEGEGSLYGGWYLDYHPNTAFRTCRLCSQCQTQNLEWK